MYVLVMVDHFSKFVIAELVHSMMSDETVNVLLAMLLKYNITECCIRSDNAFKSTKFIETMEMLNIHVRFGIPYNSQSNSEVERMNRSVR